jgi:hypothetical protein
MSGLVAEIHSVIRQHLVAARDSLTGLLERLDAPATVDRPSAPANSRAAPDRQASAATLKARKRRQKERQATGAANGEPAASGGDWPTLRQQLRDRIAESGSSYAEIAVMVGCKKSTLETWASRNSPPPGRDSTARFRKWLHDAPTAPAAEPEAPAEPAAPEDSLTLFRLSDGEQDRLRGHLSMSDDRTLRTTFNATRPLLEKAAAGSRVDSEVVPRMRAALANSAAE